MKEEILKIAAEQNMLNPHKCIDTALKLFDVTGDLVNAIKRKDNMLEIDAVKEIEKLLTILCEQLKIESLDGSRTKGYRPDTDLILRLCVDAGDICEVIEFFTFRDIKPELDWYYSTLLRLANERGIKLELDL